MGAEEDAVRDAILVTDADSDTGQLVVLSAILQRLRVRALVKDAKAATAAFGPYVEVRLPPTHCSGGTPQPPPCVHSPSQAT